jgi:predicted ribonuclease YlaK
MTTATLDEILTQAETLTPEEQLTLLARLAERIRVVYAQQSTQPQKLTIDEHLAEADYTGGRLFKTAEEVDAYIREERDSWD